MITIDFWSEVKADAGDKERVIVSGIDLSQKDEVRKMIHVLKTAELNFIDF